MQKEYVTATMHIKNVINENNEYDQLLINKIEALIIVSVYIADLQILWYRFKCVDVFKQHSCNIYDILLWLW